MSAITQAAAEDGNPEPSNADASAAAAAAAAGENKDDDVEGMAEAFASLSVDAIPKLTQIFDKLVAEHPVSVGKHASTDERKTMKENPSTLVYGEIRFESYAIAIEKIKNKYGGLQSPGGVFYDLGSGTGKPTLSAALLHDFDKVKGIELLQGLYNISLELQEVWKNKICPMLPPRKRQIEVSFTHGDITQLDWSDATLCFANSTCFDEPLMRVLAEKADAMPPGSFFITFTKSLKSPNWEVLEHESHRMSWGAATVYIHRRKAATVASSDDQSVNL